MNYVLFNLISTPVRRPPPFLFSGTCQMHQPLHNTTKTISSCGSRLEYPPLVSPEHQIIIKGFMLQACIKLIAHTGNRARRITYRNGFHLALVLLLENMLHTLHSSVLVWNIFRINMLKDTATMHTVPLDACTWECLNITGFPPGQGSHSLCLRNCMTQRDKDNGKAQVANVCVCALACPAVVHVIA